MSRLIDLVLFTVAGRPIYASAAVITLGIHLCVGMTLALYRENHRSVSAVLSLAVLGFVLLDQGLSVYTVVGSALMIVSIMLLLKEKSSK